MAKKSKEIKLTQEELLSISEIQTGYENIRKGLGDLEISRMQTEKTLDNISNEKIRLETEYTTLTQLEVNLVNSLNEKYGQGQIDPVSGAFTPNK